MLVASIYGTMSIRVSHANLTQPALLAHALAQCVAK